MPEANAADIPEQFPLPFERPVLEAVPARVVISREDMLESENLQLKSIAAVREIQLLQQELQAIQQRLPRLLQDHQTMLQQINAKRVELETKYGIDLKTHQINPATREVVPRSEPAKTNAGQEGV